jgi:predicted dehydrogenase/threonine dehydrogenase-like Zn-dependent dehydrogenase
MRQVFLEKGIIAVKDICQPVLDDYAVLVSVHYSFISSGTESATLSQASTGALITNFPQKIKKVLESITLHGIQGTKALIKGRLAGSVQSLGYSCAGKVIAVGSKVKKIRFGDLVACAGAGYAYHADIVCVPENLVVILSDEKFLRTASITTIGAIALQGLRRANIQLGETICVLGLGLIGQLTVQLAKISGCKVIGIDIVPERLELARSFGADIVYHVQEQEIEKEIEFFTYHQGVDATVITAASPAHTIMQQAMQITRKRGRVVIVGDVGLNVERSPFYQKEIDLLMSCSYGPGRYDTSYELQGQDYPFAYVRWTENRNMQAVVELIEKDSLKIDNLSLEVPVEQAAQGYELIKEKKTLGVVLSYLPKEEVTFVPQQGNALNFKPATHERLRVGIVGAGGFAKVKLMPIIARIRSARINAIVDADMATATNVSRTYGAAKALSNDHDLFTEDLVDAVIIASPHKYHCDQALRALTKGKAVFVEKPMVTDFEQLGMLNKFLRQHHQVPFCVDYNRAFAPFMQKIKKVIERRSTPIVALYRMNAGFISKNHWIQTSVGAGRIIGEACHIFDLFCFLTDSKPIAVSVEALKPRSDDLFPTDNFSAQISFGDGSVCTLLYTALGHAGLGKERMELFFDSKAIIMDDYLTLQGYGLPSSFNESVLTADKGHEILLNKFFECIRDNEAMPISFDRLTMVAELTLVIDQLACQGGGNRDLR